MKKLGKRKNTTLINVEPDEGERTLLPSSKGGIRSPSLDFTNRKSKEELLNELADIFVESILWEISNGKQQEKSGDILPGFD